MTWHWTPDTMPDDTTLLDHTFPTQGEAETWLGEFYPDLLDQGVLAVSLYEADRRVYGPMGLTPEV